MSDGRIAVFESTHPPDDAPLCPDWQEMNIPDDECPEVCARALLALQWIEADGRPGETGGLMRATLGGTLPGG